MGKGKDKEELNIGSKELRVFHEESGVLMDVLTEESGLFRSVMAMLKEGEATVELKKRYMLRAIDEAWVSAIEDALPYLDAAIRNPSKFIVEREEILPIEMSKNISPASLRHLAQHTDMIQKVEGDKITPSKLLNVFKEETLLTYENRFLNTLIRNLTAFVTLRYDVAKKEGKDEKDTTLTFEQDFSHGSVKGKLNFSIHISEPPDERDVIEKNYTSTTDLWKRVVRIRDVVSTFASSEFVRNMEGNYVRPPIMKTNALLKNPNLQKCLALYQFIEGYEAAGFSMLVQEDLENIPESYLTDIYRAFAAQYLSFRYNIQNDFNEAEVLENRFDDATFSPKVVRRLNKLREEEFDIYVDEDEEAETESREKRSNEMTLALAVALRASDIMLSANPEESLKPGDIPEPEPVPEYEEEPEEAEETAETQAEPARETPAEKPAEEQAEEKTEEKAEETEAKAEETPETAENKAEETTGEKTEETAETVENKAEETTEEKTEETSETAETEPEKTTEPAEEKPEETAEEKSEEKLEETAETEAEEKAEEKVEETSETAETKPEEKVEEKRSEVVGESLAEKRKRASVRKRKRSIQHLLQHQKTKGLSHDEHKKKS